MFVFHKQCTCPGDGVLKEKLYEHLNLNNFQQLNRKIRAGIETVIMNVFAFAVI